MIEKQKEAFIEDVQRNAQLMGLGFSGPGRNLEEGYMLSGQRQGLGRVLIMFEELMGIFLLMQERKKEAVIRLRGKEEEIVLRERSCCFFGLPLCYTTAIRFSNLY